MAENRSRVFTFFFRWPWISHPLQHLSLPFPLSEEPSHAMAPPKRERVNKETAVTRDYTIQLSKRIHKVYPFSMFSKHPPSLSVAYRLCILVPCCFVLCILHPLHILHLWYAWSITNLIILHILLKHLLLLSVRGAAKKLNREDVGSRGTGKIVLVASQTLSLFRSSYVLLLSHEICPPGFIRYCPIDSISLWSFHSFMFLDFTLSSKQYFQAPCSPCRCWDPQVRFQDYGNLRCSHWCWFEQGCLEQGKQTFTSTRVFTLASFELRVDQAVLVWKLLAYFLLIIIPKILSGPLYLQRIFCFQLICFP